MKDCTHQPMTACPTRKPNLIEVAAGDDLLVYDPESHHAYCLGPEAAALWRRCDGTTPIDELVGAEDATLWDAFVSLCKDGLIVGVPAREQSHMLNRHGFMRATGAVAAGAVVLPLIHSVLVPTAAAAASPFGGGPGGGGSSGGIPTGGDGGILGDGGSGGSGGLPGDGGSGGLPGDGGSGGKHDHGGSGGKHDHGGSGGKHDHGGSGGKHDHGGSGGKHHHHE